MAKFGATFTCGYGSHSRHLSGATRIDTSRPGCIRVRVAPATGWGDAYFGIYVRSALSAVVYVEDGAVSPWVSVPARGSVSDVAIIRHGPIANLDLARLIRTGFSPEYSRRVTLSWTWPAEVIGISGNSDLSAWSLSGLTPDNMEPGSLLTRRVIRVTMETDSVTTITLSVNGVAVASGTCVAPATCTLSESNDSGISGSVAVGAAPTDITDEDLVIRFPAELEIYRNSGTLAGSALFPLKRWTEAAELAAGDYDYSYLWVSDTGEDGTESTPEVVTVPGPPDPPEDVEYASGNAAATVVSFTITDSAAQHAAFIQEPDDEYIDLDNAVATVGAGTAEITLPALTIPSTGGVVYVIIRAYAGGIYSDNTDRIAIEYDNSGNYVQSRPNSCRIKSWSLAAGGALTVVAAYDTADEIGTATTARIFTRAVGGSYAQADSETLAGSGIKTATLTATLSNGWHEIAVKAGTADGVLSADYSDAILVYASDAAASAPAPEVYIARG